MTVDNWHVHPELLARYARGDVDEAHGFSVDAHLPSCRQCTEQIAPLLDRARLARTWDGIEARLDVPSRGMVEGGLVRLGVPGHLARLLGATPALRASWLLACALVLAFAVWAASRRADGLVMFLMLAPLLPVAGIAAAFGPDVDPAYEIGLAAPMRSFALLLLRALAVLGTTTVMAGIGALALPGLHPSAAAWLLPSLGLTLASIALATRIDATAACASLALLWVLVVIAGWVLTAEPLLVFGPAGQIACALLAAVAALSLAPNNDRFDRRGGIA